MASSLTYRSWVISMQVRARLFVVLCLAAFGVAARLQAQQGPPKPGDAVPERAAPSTAAPFVYERYHVRVRVEPDGKGSRELTWQIRVNNDTGVRQAGQIPLNYAPASDALTISKLEVRKPGGRTIVVGPEAVQDHAIQPFAGATTFVDLRQKMITVPSLQPGDTILLTAVWSIERPLIAQHSWFQHTFIKDMIVADERLVVDVPAGYPIVLRTAPSAPAEEHGGDGQVSQGRRIYQWQSSNATLPVESDEEEEVHDEAPVEDVRLTTFRDWAAMADWFRPLLHPAADAAVRAKAQELTASIPDREDKIRAVYHYVATQIRYVSLSFGVGRFAPHTPAEVLKNQYGDCKDKHALLVAMLDAIGVRAVGVLINTTRSVSDDMPSPAEFDHVITAIPAGDDATKWLWLDSTAEIAPAGLLVAALRDKQALFVGERAGSHRLVTTPADGPFAFVTTFEVEGEVNPLGVLVGRIRLRSRGDDEIVLRAAARALPAANVEEFGKGFFKAAGFDGEISDVKLGDPTATREPYEMSAVIRRGGLLDWAAEKSTLSILIGDHDAEGLEGLKKDRRIGTPVRNERRLRVTLPAGYTSTAPVGVSVANGGLEYHASYNADGRVLTANRVFVRSARVLESRHAAAYAALGRTVLSDARQTFAIAGRRSGVPAVPGDIKAGELYSAGYSAYNAKDYETAAQLWKRTSELDPKMPRAWSGLGFAYQQLKRYDEAIAAMEKQIELDPSNKRIHTDLGFVAKQGERFDVAARAYTKHIELNPLDGEVHKTLGEIHIDREDYAAAVPVLEKAAKLLQKPDAWVHVFLGAAHLGQGRPEPALAAFDRALAIDDTPAVSTRIGWELAMQGVEPVRSNALLDRTLKAAREQTAGLTAADLKAEHMDLMKRLMWSWDARGLLAMRRNDVAAAIRYFEAAWRFGGDLEPALHLGEAYEAAPNRSSDALNVYLSARSVRNQESAALDEKIKRLAANIDIASLTRAAQSQFMAQRSVVVTGDWADGKADFSAVLDRDGRVLDVKWQGGDERQRDMEKALVGRKFPVSVPDAEALKLAVKLSSVCQAPRGCGVFLRPLGDLD